MTGSTDRPSLVLGGRVAGHSHIRTNRLETRGSHTFRVKTAVLGDAPRQYQS